MSGPEPIPYVNKPLELDAGAVGISFKMSEETRLEILEIERNQREAMRRMPRIWFD
jgi:hypothetical protein